MGKGLGDWANTEPALTRHATPPRRILPDRAHGKGAQGTKEFHQRRQVNATEAPLVAHGEPAEDGHDVGSGWVVYLGHGSLVIDASSRH
jgi:hypothetical protein